MTYGVIVTVSAPVETYDRLHGELFRRTGGDVEGLLTHVSRTTDQGFQVIEVWESKEQFDRCNREVVWPLAGELGYPPTPVTGHGAPVTEEFEVRGLVVPGRRVAL